MIIYIVIKAGTYPNEAHTTLKAACDDAGVSYSSAKRGKRTWEGINIKDITLLKVSTRGGERIKGGHISESF